MNALIKECAMNKLTTFTALLLAPLAALHAAVEPIPAFTTGARILFIGDSITDMNRGRSADPNHILGHGYVFLIAARQGAAFPELQLDFVNRGISGNTVLDLEKRWKKDMIDLKPDMLSVLIGVNDYTTKIPLDQYEQVYDKLIGDARAVASERLKWWEVKNVNMWD
jgi:lysophospholipase L1-like esterase